MGKRIDITGEKFGHLTVICYDGYYNKTSWWKCECECGNITIVRLGSLRRGATKSCGCLLNEMRKANKTKCGQNRKWLFTER